MIEETNKITKLVDKQDYSTLKLYVSLGFDLTLTDLNGDFASKFGWIENEAFNAVLTSRNSALKRINLRKLNVQNNNGYSSLHWAIMLHNNEAAKYLIDNDADVGASTVTNENVFSLAARFDNTEIFFYLLKKKYKYVINLLNSKNERGFTTFHFACANKNKKIISCLLNNKDEKLIKERNIYNATPLHWLVHGRNISDDLKSLLLEIFFKELCRGYHKKVFLDMLKTKNALGLTPLDWLEFYRNYRSYDLITREF